MLFRFKLMNKKVAMLKQGKAQPEAEQLEAKMQIYNTPLDSICEVFFSKVESKQRAV